MGSMDRPDRMRGGRIALAGLAAILVAVLGTAVLAQAPWSYPTDPSGSSQPKGGSVSNSGSVSSSHGDEAGASKGIAGPSGSSKAKYAPGKVTVKGPGINCADCHDAPATRARPFDATLHRAKAPRIFAPSPDVPALPGPTAAPGGAGGSRNQGRQPSSSRP